MTALRASMGYVNLDLPSTPGILKAAGQVALAHGQLELMLRMTFKTLAGLSVNAALTRTARYKNSQLRREIDSLFKSKTTDPSARRQLELLLGRCKEKSDKRNQLVHNAWAIAPDGSVVSKGETHAWGPAATPHDLTLLASDIQALVAELNEARLTGFIRLVVNQSP